MNRRISSLEGQIARIKREIARLADLRPGSLSEQYNVCGKPGCRCKASPPKKHGPYYQLSYTRKGKSSSRFVRRQDLAAVKQHLKNYARLRNLVDSWIELATELSNLRLDEERAQSRSQT